jgi:GH15 family glucan-1,4-alpha-glucosidase
MDRAARIATLLNKKYYAETWKGIAEDIREDVFTRGWNKTIESFTQTYGSSDLDASLLLMAEYGFISPDDERYRKTVKAVRDALYYNGLVYRYKNEDDFGNPNSSFTICTFWLIQALYRTGQKEEARKMFDSLMACGNHLGLFSEDIDFNSRRLLGNFPQAYSHLALINTAVMFSKEKKVSRFIKP